ncbi:hypothetical protein JHK82_055405 [Glycine max]|nr:hypothetical protein JHK86_055242 [Glycine max]KAG4917948.1 hypothetical protein JHK85_056229 [Glycine max]KAG5074041.1 hypothetical protein JHK84_055272 [Glycine max]KAG5076710.1 hypothetical protein JHK82_055405 [Glycine max]
MSSKQLNQLWLTWNENEESKFQENVEEILEVLQPNAHQLESLRVGGYKVVHFPQWMSSPSLKYLSCLELEDCKSCLKLPLLGKLPSLNRLIISNIMHVKYLYEESFDGGVIFMALEKLTLSYLANLIISILTFSEVQSN